MWCPTRKLVDFIDEKYLAKYKAFEGARYLRTVLHKGSSHQRDLTQLQAQLHDLRSQKMLGILSDEVHVRQANYRLSTFLDHLVEEERKYIFVLKGSGIHNKVDGVLEGSNPNEYPKSVLGYSKNHFKIKLGKDLVGLGRIIFALAILAIISLFIYHYVKNSNSTDYIENSVNNSSPLNQVTSWINEEADLWAIHLRSYPNYRDAVKVKNSYRQRDIDIVKLNDDRYYLFIFHDTQDSAMEEYSGGKIKSKWKYSRIIPIDLCRPLYDDREEYYLCL